MKEMIIASYRFNLLYAEQLVIDVAEDLMTKAGTKALEKHPAFTLGHLVTASAMTSRYLGGPYEIPEGWEELFKRKGPGDPRTPSLDSNAYPSKELLLQELKKQHLLVANLISNMKEEQFEEPAKWRFAQYMPTLGDLIHFMCINHESMHLGQLAAWRRAQGLPSALARL